MSAPSAFSGLFASAAAARGGRDHVAARQRRRPRRRAARRARSPGTPTEPLAAGVVTPALNASNVHDQAALAAAFKAVADRLAPRPKRIALILPDTVAKVSLLRFEKIPAKVQELDQLIRWQMRKAAPFRIEDAQVSWTEGARPRGRRARVLVVVAAPRHRRELREAPAMPRACTPASSTLRR